MPAEDGMQCRWMQEGYWGYLYLKVVLSVMDGKNGNEMAMLDVYDVEGKVRAALAQKTGSEFWGRR